MNTTMNSFFKLLVVSLMVSVPMSDANAFWWLLRGASARSAAGVAARGAVGAGTVAESAEAMALSRKLAASARFCIRPVGEVACDFRSAATPTAAIRGAVGPQYGVRNSRTPTTFEILDAAGNVISIIEVLDRQSHPDFDELPAYFPPPEAVIQNNEYEVACGPGYAPGAYNSNPKSFEHWSCSNGSTYYNAAPTCQPGKPGWRVWQVIGGRLGRPSSRPS